VKVAIVGGAGGVGSSLAFDLLLLEQPFDVVLVDPRDGMVASHVLDLEQVLALGGTGSIRSGDPSDVVDADVVVLTAGVPLVANTSRHVYLEANAEILTRVASDLASVSSAWHGVMIVATNPVDPLCVLAHAALGVERTRIVGYTLNDTLRLRTGIGQALGVPVERVEAWVLGEHGDGCVPLFDRVLVDGGLVRLTAEQRESAESFLRTWYVRHVALNSGRTSTWTSGLGLSRMVAAIADGDDAVWPASVVLDGEYGIRGAALTVPVRLGPTGVQSIDEWQLEATQLESMRRAADIVVEATRSIDVTARDERLIP
jgi:malate dehydrogenase